MKIGAHVSIAGGIWNAPKNAADLGCEVFQVFTRSPQGGSAPKIDDEVVKKFKEEMRKWGQTDCYIHAPYYINFASADQRTREASVRVVREELERGSLIGAKYLMTHLGSSTPLTASSSTSFEKAQDKSLTASSSKDFSREEGLKLVVSGVKAIVKGYKGSTQFLLEISAGAGNIMGDTFEELEQMIGGDDRVGICLDSAHMFASGYDIKTKDGFSSVIKVIKKTVGPERIKLIHANDSKVGLGERKDRHDHIGDGKIGMEGFKNLVKTFPGIDFILETKHDKVAEDIKKLKEMRSKNDGKFL